MVIFVKQNKNGATRKAKPRVGQQNESYEKIIIFYFINLYQQYIVFPNF